MIYKSKWFRLILGASVALFIFGLIGIWDAMANRSPGYYVRYQLLCFIIGMMIIASIMRNKDFKYEHKLFFFICGLLLNILPIVGKQIWPRYIYLQDICIYPGPSGFILSLPLLAYYIPKIEHQGARISTFLFPAIFVLLFNIMFYLQGDEKQIFLLDIMIIVLLLLSNLKIGKKYIVFTFLLYPSIGAFFLFFDSRYHLYMAFNCKNDISGCGFQLYEAQKFIKSGGLFGIGFNNLIQGHICPIANISKCFILQYTGKETGIAGLIFVVGLIGVFLYSGFKLMSGSQNRENHLTAICMFMTLLIPSIFGVIKAFAIISGFPSYSIPFMSYNNGIELSYYLALGFFLKYTVSSGLNKPDKVNQPEDTVSLQNQ